MPFDLVKHWPRILRVLDILARIAGIVLLACVIAPVFAATPTPAPKAVSSPVGPTASATVTLNWPAPTLNTDGSALTGSLTYNLYQGPKAGPVTKVASGLTGTSTVLSTLTAGACFWLSAVEVLPGNTVESTPTGPICAVQPNPPGTLSVSITVTIQ